jgi:hypothetical protein
MFQLKEDFYVCKGTLLLMFFIHTISFTLELIRTIISECNKECVLMPFIFDLLIIVMYQGSIFYLQIVFITLEEGVDNITAMSWI